MSTSMLKLGVCTALVCAASAIPGIPEAKKSFEGHQVWRVSVDSAEDNARLQAIKENMSGLDWWIDPSEGLDVADVRVAPENAERLDQALSGMSVSVYIDDVQALVDAQHVVSTLDNGDSNKNWHRQYHTFDEIVEWTLALVDKFPDLAESFDIGQTHEGRPIVGLKITSPNGGENKPQIAFDGALHSREWVSSATVQYMMWALLTEYGENDRVTRLVDEFEWYILPVVNGDGYAYTWESDRMWRKTRKPNPGTSCYGTDPNRNWEFQWAVAGSSNNPCADDYHGSEAFSEVETHQLAMFLTDLPRLASYMNFHAYSQLWMTPWGYTSQLPADYDEMAEMSARVCDAIQSVHGTKYRYGSISNIIYPAAGSSADYVYGTSGVVHSYGVELRDLGRYGFLLPPEQILPSGEETFEGVLVLAETLLEEAARAGSIVA